MPVKRIHDSKSNGFLHQRWNYRPKATILCVNIELVNICFEMNMK